MVKDLFDKKFKEIFSSEIAATIFGVIAGVLLLTYTDKVFLIPGMMILLPGFLEMRGNISGAFAARLSSGLFLHIINPKHTHTKIIKGNLIASFFLAVLTSFVLGILAFIFNYYILDLMTWEIIFIPLIGGIIANVIEIPLTLATTLYLFKKGHDPNNIMGPFITSTGDVTSIVGLLIAVMLI